MVVSAVGSALNLSRSSTGRCLEPHIADATASHHGGSGSHQHHWKARAPCTCTCRRGSRQPPQIAYKRAGVSVRVRRSRVAPASISIFVVVTFAITHATCNAGRVVPPLRAQTMRPSGSARRLSLARSLLGQAKSAERMGIGAVVGPCALGAPDTLGDSRAPPRDPARSSPSLPSRRTKRGHASPTRLRALPQLPGQTSHRQSLCARARWRASGRRRFVDPDYAGRRSSSSRSAHRCSTRRRRRRPRRWRWWTSRRSHSPRRTRDRRARHGRLRRSRRRRAEAELAECDALAWSLGESIGELGCPVLMYGARAGRSLLDTRRGTSFFKSVRGLRAPTTELPPDFACWRPTARCRRAGG